MKTIIKICLLCQESFEASLREHNRGNAKFCCQSHAAKYNSTKYYAKKNQPNVYCSLCKKHFYRSKSKLLNSKSGHYFCSRKCKDSAQQLGGIKDIMPSHYGSGRFNYRAKAFNNHIKECKVCGYDKYIEVLVVHHKDRDRTNNSLSNLEILCPTCHMVEHFLCRDGLWG